MFPSRLFVLTVLLTAMSASQENEVLSLTLEDGIVRSLQENLGIASEAIHWRTAQISAREAGDVFIPSLSFNYNLQETNSRTTTWLESSKNLQTFKLSGYPAKKNLLDSIYNIETAYWNLVYAQELLKVREQSVALAGKLLPRLNLNITFQSTGTFGSRILWLKDVESLDVCLSYGGKSETTSVYLQKGRSANIVTMNSAQFSREVDLEGQAVYDGYFDQTS